MTTTSLALHSARLAVCRAAIQALPEGGDVPETITVIPAGRSVGADGRIFMLSDPAAVVARFRAQVPVDVEHSTHIKAPAGEPAPAVGWVTALRVVDGAIVADVAWNAAGKALVGDKAYRYISPAFTHTAAGDVVELKSIGLTNSPNLTDLPALNQEQDTMDRSKLIQMLGLKADATDADIEAAINQSLALNRNHTPDPKIYIPRADYDVAINRATKAESDLKAIKDAGAEAEYVALVDGAVKDGKVAPASKDHYLGLCRAGQVDTVKALFATAPKIVGNPSPAAGDPTKPVEGQLSDDQLAVCRRMGVSEKDFLAAGKL